MDIIPHKFLNLLNSVSDEISGAVGNVMSKVEPILKRNESVFFQDYTDHGFEHIKSVLKTAEVLIGNDTWSVFTREDAAALVLATIAHDLGMLIDKDGFQSLITSNEQNICSECPNDHSWEKLWQDFQIEVKRFDGNTLINILGTQDPVSADEFDISNLSERGIRLVGEFLRRHHHRLGHELICFGYPSGNGRVLLFENVAEHLRVLVGVIARSHGLPLREAVELLIQTDRTRHREYRHIHPTYLMCLVRLADYLDLDISRAPESILAAKSLRSPISKREWWSHRAIVDCHSYDDDPECLRIIIDPHTLDNVEIFTTVEDKINNVQQELDSCWAVLGEIYGRFPPLNKFSLQIRRIKSDIRDQKIISKLPFIPHKSVLNAARADLLKLLIAPLYGDHPSVGIRELIQNSIDAVNEFNFAIKKLSPGRHEDRLELEADVVVQFEQDANGDYWIIIADRGIGMTWETIQKYYLTAGASFRQSDIWKKSFIDESGSSNVLRAGRFGIGVLAGFLLGERIQVCTRHLEAPENMGIQLEFGLDDTNIEMKWLTTKIGTTVKVKMYKGIVDSLNFNDGYNYYNKEDWDWYGFKSPVLIRKNLEGKILKQKFLIPGLEWRATKNWHRIQVPYYQAVDWSYSKNYDHNFFCNGLLIKSGNLKFHDEFAKHKPINTYYYMEELSFVEPSVSIFDADGRLPLTLARNDMRCKDNDLNKYIVDDMIKNFIVYCLLKGPDHAIFSSEDNNQYINLSYPGFRSIRSDRPILFSTNEGFGLSDPWNIFQFISTKNLIVRSQHNEFNTLEKVFKNVILDYGIILPIKSDGTLNQFDYCKRKLTLSCTQIHECLPFFYDINLKNLKILMPKKWYNRYIEKQPLFVQSCHTIKKEINNFVIIAIGDDDNDDSTMMALVNKIKNEQPSFESITEFVISPNASEPAPGRIAEIWKDVIGSPIIPYDKSKRKEILERLGDDFKKHVAEWQ